MIEAAKVGAGLYINIKVSDWHVLKCELQHDHTHTHAHNKQQSGWIAQHDHLPNLSRLQHIRKGWNKCQCVPSGFKWESRGWKGTVQWSGTGMLWLRVVGEEGSMPMEKGLGCEICMVLKVSSVCLTAIIFNLGCSTDIWKNNCAYAATITSVMSCHEWCHVWDSLVSFF